MRVNVGNEGLYLPSTATRVPETFFRIKNCVISLHDFTGSGAGGIYAIIMSEGFRPYVKPVWKKEKFEVEEFLLEKDGVIIKELYIGNFESPDEMPGLERGIVINYMNENNKTSLIEFVLQFRDNDKAHKNLENFKKTIDYILIGPVKLGDEGYVLAFSSHTGMIPSITFRIKNVMIVLLSPYGPGNALKYGRFMEEFAKAQ